MPSIVGGGEWGKAVLEVARGVFDGGRSGPGGRWDQRKPAPLYPNPLSQARQPYTKGQPFPDQH